MSDEISSAELDIMREDYEAAFLPDTCDVDRRTPVPDGTGSAPLTWVSVNTSVACRIESTPWQIRWEIDADKFTLHDRWYAFFEWDQDIQSGDRLTLSNGVLLYVTDTEDLDPWRVFLRVVAIRRSS